MQTIRQRALEVLRSTQSRVGYEHLRPFECPSCGAALYSIQLERHVDDCHWLRDDVRDDIRRI